MDARTKAFIYMHIAVILFGFTAILGVLIDLSAIMIVWWRVGLAASFLFILLLGSKKLRLKSIRKINVLIFGGIGCIVALHWITFYLSIKLSNASIALVCFATTAFFTAVIEPIVLSKNKDVKELCIGLIIIPGMYFIVSDINSAYHTGILIGLLSALLSAIFASFNKKYIKLADPFTISFIEMAAAFLFISIILPFVNQLGLTSDFYPTTNRDWLYIVILAFGCTTVAFVLSMKALQYISAFTSNLIINLEPIYGIILAIILLQEHQTLNPNFYFGAVIIIVSVFIYPFINTKSE